MSQLPTLPLIRASFFEPFYLLAKELGSPVESLMQSLHLPAQMPDESDLLLPEVQCWKFVQAIVESEGYTLFGLEATTRNPWTGLSTMQPLFKDCANLYTLLKRLVYFAPLQSKTSHFALEEESDFIWFVDYSACLLPEQDSTQIMVSALLGMMQLVQTAAGDKWRPAEIHLTIGYSRKIEYAKQLNPSRILFSQPVMKFSVPRSLLALPLANFVKNAHVEEKYFESYEPIADSFIDQLTASLIPHLGGGAVNKKLLADIVEMSPRTLQRRLEQHSSSYSTIIDQARFMRAQTLLKTLEISLIDISLMLGYQNASSFTRSFRRWCGVSPKEFQLYSRNCSSSSTPTLQKFNI
ncbi:MAG: helix-turn-helix domain-containing protein [Methyloprofundus sp.]|nr:helix-turn-helix domain-containing protein [Methyloprofundus sp.]